MTKLTWLAAGLVSLLVTACSGGSYSISVGQLNSSSHTISGDYRSFSGYYFREDKFAQGEQVQFHFDSHTDGGKISARLINSSGSTVSTLTTDKTVQIPQTGTYKIEVEADHHKGGFSLSWHDADG